MNPVLFAVAVGIPAIIIGAAMLWFCRPIRYWCTIDYLCAKKRDLGMGDNNTHILIVIERDYAMVQNREERAWTMELVSGTRSSIPLEKAKQLIASFTRADRE